MLAPSVPESRYRRAVFWRDQSVQAGREVLAGRLYAPAAVPDEAGLVVHLHGGTFDSGSLAAGEAVATTLAEAGAIVISLPYPLAPEHRFPEALETAYAALESGSGAIRRAGSAGTRRSMWRARRPAATSPRGSP